MVLSSIIHVNDAPGTGLDRWVDPSHILAAKSVIWGFYMYKSR